MFRTMSADTLAWGAPPVHLALPAAGIHLFSFSLDLSASRVSRLERLLAADELARAGRFKFLRHRTRYLAGRGMLRTILGRYLDRDPAELQFRCGANGKPALQGSDDHERVRFNLSRSEGLGILAIQLNEDLGVDLECLRPFPDALQIAERLFAAEEAGVLRALPEPERSLAFFHYWTRKEAVIKSIGHGLSYPVHTFTLSPEAGTAEQLVLPDATGMVTRWLLPVPVPAGGYLAAVATAGPAPCSLTCWTWPVL